MQEYDRLGPEAFFSAHGFVPTTTYDPVWIGCRRPLDLLVQPRTTDVTAGR